MKRLVLCVFFLLFLFLWSHFRALSIAEHKGNHSLKTRQPAINVLVVSGSEQLGSVEVTPWIEQIRLLASSGLIRWLTRAFFWSLDAATWDLRAADPFAPLTILKSYGARCIIAHYVASGRKVMNH